MIDAVPDVPDSVNFEPLLLAQKVSDQSVVVATEPTAGIITDGFGNTELVPNGIAPTSNGSVTDQI
jgi:hypothetical protein